MRNLILVVQADIPGIGPNLHPFVSSDVMLRFLREHGYERAAEAWSDLGERMDGLHCDGISITKAYLRGAVISL